VVQEEVMGRKVVFAAVVLGLAVSSGCVHGPQNVQPWSMEVLSPGLANGNPMALPMITTARSRAITYENQKGEPGQGGQKRGGRKGAPAYDKFEPGTKFTMMDIDGPGIVKHIWITIPPGNVDHMRNVIVRMWWDHEEEPSVEAPFLDFFAQAHGLQKEMYSSLVTATLGRGFNSFIPMPFNEHARIEFENQSDSKVGALFYQVDYDLLDALPGNCGRFHAQWRRQNPTVEKDDYVLLDNVKQPGVYIGTMIGVHTHGPHWWGEGEFKFYVEGDEEYPTICGTGTEDYFCAAWGMGEYQYAYHGCTMNESVGSGDTWVSMYRWHVVDPIRFKELKKVTCQQIGWGNGLFERSDDWCSTAYWYQMEPHTPFPPLPDKAARMKDLRLKAEKK
jgi:hypothetical protein